MATAEAEASGKTSASLLSAFWSWWAPLLNPKHYVACHLSTPEHESWGRRDARRLLSHLQWQLTRKLKISDIGMVKNLMRGQGLDFANLREYVPGDDVRKIDWNVFARTFTPHVREHHEEKQISVWLVVDLTPSMFCGRLQTKARYAIEMAGLLGLLAEVAGYRIGLYVYGAQGRHIEKPQAGSAYLQRVMGVLMDWEAQCREDLIPFDSAVLQGYGQELAKLIGKQSDVLVLSDLLDMPTGFLSHLGQVSRHSMVAMMALHDPVQSQLPEGAGVLTVLDPETGFQLNLDTSKQSVKSRYTMGNAVFQEHMNDALSLFQRVLWVETHRQPVDNVVTLIRGGHR